MAYAQAERGAGWMKVFCEGALRCSHLTWNLDFDLVPGNLVTRASVEVYLYLEGKLLGKLLVGGDVP